MSHGPCPRREVPLSETETMIRARESIHTSTTMIRVTPDRGVALCLLLVDRSGSMQKHGDSPRLAANELISVIRTAEGADHTMFGLYTFNHEVTLELPPVLASRAQDLLHYHADGNTSLYQAVHEALAIGLEFRGFAAQQYDAIAKVAITVISDGGDTSSPTFAGPCRELARVARENEFALQAIGLGIDAKALARLLGFDPDLAHSEEATNEGLTQSVLHTSRLFKGTMAMHGTGRSTPTPPSGS